MQLFKRVNHISPYIAYLKSMGFSIGFAPTMGALHQGHLSLVKHAINHSNISVASLFVNPTQFNEPSDLEKYPRTFEADTTLLYNQGLHVLFAPDVEDIYPAEGIQTPTFDFQGLDTVLEGVHRPGHFAGVAQVVHRLLEIVKPDHLYMGQKDYQQWTLIFDLLRQMKSDIELIMVPTVREWDGLAMSSRNRRLTDSWRQKAPKIFEILNWVQSNIEKIPPKELSQIATKKLVEESFHPEYLSIVDGYSLLPVDNMEDHQKVVVCVAAWAGDIRLIDNLILKDTQVL